MLLPINIGGQFFLLPINNDRKKKNDNCEKMTIGEAIFAFIVSLVIVAALAFLLFVLLEVIAKGCGY